jgi:hypothetical protein
MEKEKWLLLSISYHPKSQIRTLPKKFSKREGRGDHLKQSLFLY